MKIEKVGVIEKYIISEATKKLTNKEKLKLADKMFRDMYQGNTLIYKELKKEMLVYINRDTRHNFSAHKKQEKNKAHLAKLEIACDGKFIEFVSNPKYDHTKAEKKIGQSKNHKKNQKYHYFLKEVYIDDKLYKVLINVRESTSNKCIVYYVEMLNK